MRLLAGLLLAGCVFAQPVPVSPADAEERRIIEARLASAEPADLAWGAHLAANYRQLRYVPRIIDLLPHPDWAVRLTVLDALIRLKADVPQESLAPLVKQHFDPVVILLARDLKTNGPFLSALLDDPVEDWQWVALNGILLNNPPPGYAARLLREWRPQFTVTIQDDPTRGVGRGGGFGGGSDGGAPFRRGFPPLVLYQLGTGDTLLAAGPHPVFYGVVTAYSRHTHYPMRDPYTLDHIRALTGLSEASLRRPPNAIVIWESVAKYQQEARRFLDQIRYFVSHIRDTLIERGRMLPEEATLPVLDVTIYDDRADKSVPLPAIDWGL